MDNRSISMAFVRALLAHSGADRYQLLTDADIPPALLDSGRARVSAAQFARLYDGVIQALQDESAGYYRHPMKPGCFHTMARYLLEAVDLGQVLARHVEFMNLFDTGFELQLIERGGRVALRQQPEAGMQFPPWVYEQHLMSSHRFFSWLTGTPLPLLAVNLNYPPPPHREEYHYLFFCSRHFDQPHSEIVFERRLLELPVVKGAAELEDFLSRVRYEMLHAPTREKSYTEQIRRYIKKSLPELPSYEHIAESLGLTAQTLRRRLREEGCDYRQIRNELIRDMAIDQLCHGDADVKQISYRLGFSEPSAFIRSFKKWTGSTPNSYRESHRG